MKIVHKICFVIGAILILHYAICGCLVLVCVCVSFYMVLVSVHKIPQEYCGVHILRKISCPNFQAGLLKTMPGESLLRTPAGPGSHKRPKPTTHPSTGAQTRSPCFNAVSLHQGFHPTPGSVLMLMTGMCL